MASCAFILTNSPYTKAQIALASFVPNIKQPHQDAERPYQVEASDYEVQPDNALDLINRHSSESHLKVLVTRLLSLGVGSDKDNTLRVTAKKGYIYSLKSPKALFRKLVFGEATGEGVQRWLEDCKLNKIKPRFLVGYRTFLDSRLTVGAGMGRSFSTNATVPVGAAALGGFDPKGVADVGAKIGRAKSSQAIASIETPGERIYAICYRKVKLAFRGGQMAPTLAQDNMWEAFAASRDGGEDDVYVQAELQEEGEDEDDGFETFSLQPDSGDGQPDAFAVLLDEVRRGNGEA